MKIPISRHTAAHLCFALLTLSLTCPSSFGISLLNTEAGVIDTGHPQVQTSGGNSFHLVQVVTDSAMMDYQLDMDILLADGSPLVFTIGKDSNDSDTLELTLAMVIDSEPCHVEVSLRSSDGPAPVFDSIGTTVPSGEPVNRSPSKVVIHHDAPIDIAEDVYYGDIPLRSNTFTSTQWAIDISQLSIGETFDIVLRAGPEGDFDDNDIIDLSDYEQFFNCLESTAPENSCQLYFDFNADNSVDLYDFAVFQNIFTGADTPATCGA